MALFSNWEIRFDIIWRFALVYAFMALLFLLNIAALSYPFTAVFKPPLILMMIYYWSVFRPTLLPFWMVFTGGILVDFLSGTPLGVHALVFTVIRWIVGDQRRFLMGQPFLMVWSGFLVVLAGAGLLEWGVASLVMRYPYSFDSFLYTTGLGVLVFPLIVILLQLTHKFLPTLNKNWMSSKLV